MRALIDGGMSQGATLAFLITHEGTSFSAAALGTQYQILLMVAKSKNATSTGDVMKLQ